MAGKISKKTNTTTRRASRIALGKSLCIDGAEKLHERLKKCAEKGVNVNLSAANIKAIDTSALQLLLAFVKKVRENGNTVHWQSPSDELVRSIELMGLETHLCAESLEK